MYNLPLCTIHPHLIIIGERRGSIKKVNSRGWGKIRSLELCGIVLAAYLRNGAVPESLRYCYYHTTR